MTDWVHILQPQFFLSVVGLLFLEDQVEWEYYQMPMVHAELLE